MARGLGFGEAANEGIVHEGIRRRDVGEEATSVFYSVCDGDG